MAGTGQGIDETSANGDPEELSDYSDARSEWVAGLSAKIDQLQGRLTEAAAIAANQTRFHDATIQQAESLKKCIAALVRSHRRIEDENADLRDQRDRSLGTYGLDHCERCAAVPAREQTPGLEAGVYNFHPPTFSGASSKML